jgi:hypothetical protein
MNPKFLTKVETFTKIAMSEISSLKNKVAEQEEQLEKASSTQLSFNKELRKVAKILYETDFLNDETEMALFVKRASENPQHLINTLTKVCKAADVLNFGTVAKAAMHKAAEYDPVMARAFGYHNNNGIIDDE